ncbi:MAG TPA: thiamine phosphate synthase [Bryobacteraceae bacterium]|nr:thiamine phosphate synthase [Bryobacteraceae bacterium]
MSEVFGLYLVLTDPVAGYEACAAAAVETGVRYVQLRMKNRPQKEVLEVAHRLRRITQSSGTRLIINDDLEVATEVDADGVHLGQQDLDLAEARARWPRPGKIFGLSTHNEEQELAARRLAPDYIGVGPVFPTASKENPDPVLGVDRAARIVRGSPLTAVAIGGIDAARLPGLLRAGIYNFCVLGAVCRNPNPRAAIEELQRIWRETIGPSI